LALLRVFLFLLLSFCTAGAAQEWRLLALRVDFPPEELDEPTTTGTGQFDLRSFAEALPDYRFPFDTPPHDRTYFEDHLRALSRYYWIVSEGRIDIDFEVFPKGLEEAYALPRSALSYGNGRTEEEIGEKWIELVRDAVGMADADPEGPRFADFNSFLILHAGVGHETGELNDIRSVFLSAADIDRYAAAPILADEDQFEIREAWILPESPSRRGQAGLNGLLAKFFGHQLGLPGLSNFADGLPAVGAWSLMDVGANALGYVLQDSLMLVVGFVPPHPMAWSKARLGWIEPLVVLRDTTVALLATDRRGDLPKAVRIPIDRDEYFLIENRQQRGIRGAPSGVESPTLDPEEVVWIGGEQVRFSAENRVWLEVEEYDAFIPGSGVLIWHLDEGVIRDKIAAGAINNDPVHPGIALEEADGHRDIGNPVFERLAEIEGSPRDLFFAGGQTRFGPDTRPDSRSYRGWHSGIEIEVLSEPGDIVRVEIGYPRLRGGWPQEMEGPRRVQGADADGDGAVDLVVESGRGIQMARAETGLASWRVEEARWLAAADVDADGGAEIFALRGREVSAWDFGAEEPTWTYALVAAPVDALVSAEFGLFPGRPVLALAGEELALVEARSGKLLRQVDAKAHHLTAADVDGDGERELIAAGREGLWKLKNGGREFLWASQRASFLAPAAGDLDRDGEVEIVVAEAGGRVRAVAGSGVEFTIDLGDSVRAAPALGDVDGDGFLEIVLAGTDQVHALRASGLRLADFPGRLPHFAGVGGIEGSPVLLDLDGDGKQEIFFGAWNGVYGVDDDGSLLPGFPLLTAGPVPFAPVGADLEGDGFLEVAALGGDWLYVWEPQNFSPGYAGRRAGWGQAGFSAAGTRAHPGPADEPAPDEAAGLLPAGRVYCYPNPVEDGGEVHLRFWLNRPARLRVEVFDPLGARVDRPAGKEIIAAPVEEEIVWSTRSYASGLYICRLEAQADDGKKDVAFVKMAVSR